MASKKSTANIIALVEAVTLSIVFSRLFMPYWAESSAGTIKTVLMDTIFADLPISAYVVTATPT